MKPIEVDIPMPEDEAEIDAKFSELVDELGLDKTHRDAMFNLSPEKKWQIYCSKKKDQDYPKSSSWPDYYIDKVNAMSNMFFLRDTEEEIESRAKLIDSLKTALRTQPMSFVLRFIELNGLNCLLNFLKNMDYKTAQRSIHTSVLGCLKALMNSTEGRTHVLAHPSAMDIIAQSLRTENLKTKTAVLEILGAMCLVPGGHKKVLDAMVHFQRYASERTRFQTLISDLGCNANEYCDDIISLKTAIMSFINAALKYGAGQTHLEFRLHLRYELLMLGIQPVIDKLRDCGNANLDRHLDFFEMIRTEDERQLGKKFDMNHIDTKSASAMFEMLKKKMGLHAAYPHFLSILFHLLQLPFGQQRCTQYWQLIDRIIQQITLQTKEGDPDVSPLELDVKKLVKQLANEMAMKEVHQKIRDVQKENDELVAKLAKRDRECEVKSEEKEELMQTLNKIKAKLEKETLAALDAKAQLAEMTARINELQQMVELERNERMKLEIAVKMGSLPDDTKVGLSSSALMFSGLNSLNQKNLGVDISASAPPPPPPPPPSLNPYIPCLPPSCGVPLPPAMSSRGPGGMPAGFPGVAVRKNIPESVQPLKSFNWSKLPDNKVKDTIWTDIDEAKVYKALDLDDFERNFSAYQRQEGSDSDIFNKGSVKTRELSVIDGRRAQNCTILLSKLKMTNQELAKAVMNVDAQEDIPKDMCEQLLKFVPTVEEVQMLGDHEHEIDQMAKADRFLFEMSRIDHYDQRLKALYYKKKFHERMSDAKPRVEAVLDASKNVSKSCHLRKLLEIVLAFGNYMNRGQRGNAAGFRIASLNKIIDTKSSLNKKVTLLHYLAEVIELRFPELLDLENEIISVREAAKVNLTDLEMDMNVLKSGLQEIEKEVEYHRSKGGNTSSADKFVSVMHDFVSVAAYNFSELEDQMAEMREKFERSLKLFGEEPRKMQPDEFFGIFDLFLSSFGEAKADNDRFRRQKEEDEKRQRLESQMKAEKEAKEKLRRDKKGSEEKGEFDDLISALRTGEVFGEDIAKLKRTRRRKGATDATRERVCIMQA